MRNINRWYNVTNKEIEESNDSNQYFLLNEETGQFTRLWWKTNASIIPLCFCTLNFQYVLCFTDESLDTLFINLPDLLVMKLFTLAMASEDHPPFPLAY